MLCTVVWERKLDSEIQTPYGPYKTLLDLAPTYLPNFQLHSPCVGLSDLLIPPISQTCSSLGGFVFPGPPSRQFPPPEHPETSLGSLSLGLWCLSPETFLTCPLKVPKQPLHLKLADTGIKEWMNEWVKWTNTCGLPPWGVLWLGNQTQFVERKHVNSGFNLSAQTLAPHKSLEVRAWKTQRALGAVGAKLRLRAAWGGAWPTPMRGSESRASERTLEGALERRGPAWCGRAGHGGRAELLRYLWRPPGPAAPLLLPFLPGVLPQLPSDHPAFAHRCHLQRVASGLRTLHTLRGKACRPLPAIWVGVSGLEGSLGP